MKKWSLSSALTIAALCASACGDQMTTQPRRAAAAAALDEHNTESAGVRGGVFTSSNGAAGNIVFAFARREDGSLVSAGEFPTGGNGVGGGVDPLQSQGSLLLDDDHQRLYVVNAGSNSISTFAVASDATLRLLGTVSSAGDRPISLALSRRRLFVLNADNSLVRLVLDDTGLPQPTAGARLALGEASDGPSTVAATRDGDLLFVTERSANVINVVRATEQGPLAVVETHPSSGAVPFGFAVTSRSQLIVSEAAGDAPNGAASSYGVARNGTLTGVTRASSTHQAAACWLVLGIDGRFAYVANAGSGSISGFAVAANGALSPLTASGRTGVTTTPDATPLDLGVTRDGKFLYALQTGTGTVGSFAIAANGRLTTLGDTPGLAAAAGFQGLAAY